MFTVTTKKITATNNANVIGMVGITQFGGSDAMIVNSVDSFLTHFGYIDNLFNHTVMWLLDNLVPLKIKRIEQSDNTDIKGYASLKNIASYAITGVSKTGLSAKSIDSVFRQVSSENSRILTVSTCTPLTKAAITLAATLGGVVEYTTDLTVTGVVYSYFRTYINSDVSNSFGSSSANGFEYPLYVSGATDTEYNGEHQVMSANYDGTITTINFRIANFQGTKANIAGSTLAATYEVVSQLPTILVPSKGFLANTLSIGSALTLAGTDAAGNNTTWQIKQVEDINANLHIRLSISDTLLASTGGELSYIDTISNSSFVLSGDMSAYIKAGDSVVCTGTQSGSYTVIKTYFSLPNTVIEVTELPTSSNVTGATMEYRISNYSYITVAGQIADLGAGDVIYVTDNVDNNTSFSAKNVTFSGGVTTISLDKNWVGDTVTGNVEMANGSIMGSVTAKFTGAYSSGLVVDFTKSTTRQGLYIDIAVYLNGTQVDSVTGLDPNDFDIDTINDMLYHIKLSDVTQLPKPQRVNLTGGTYSTAINDNDYVSAFGDIDPIDIKGYLPLRYNKFVYDGILALLDNSYVGFLNMPLGISNLVAVSNMIAFDLDSYMGRMFKGTIKIPHYYKSNETLVAPLSILAVKNFVSKNKTNKAWESFFTANFSLTSYSSMLHTNDALLQTDDFVSAFRDNGIALLTKDTNTSNVEYYFSNDVTLAKDEILLNGAIQGIIVYLRETAAAIWNKYRYLPNNHIIWVNINTDLTNALEEVRTGSGIDSYIILDDSKATSNAELSFNSLADILAGKYKAQINLVAISTLQEFSLNLVFEQ